MLKMNNKGFELTTMLVIMCLIMFITGAFDNVAETQPKLNTEAKQLQYLDNIYGGLAEIIVADLTNIREKLTLFPSIRMLSATISAVTRSFPLPG